MFCLLLVCLFACSCVSSFVALFLHFVVDICCGGNLFVASRRMDACYWVNVIFLCANFIIHDSNKFCVLYMWQDIVCLCMCCIYLCACVSHVFVAFMFIYISEVSTSRLVFELCPAQSVSLG